MDPLRQEIDKYENDRDLLLVELTDLEEELGDYTTIELFEADFMSVDDLPTTTAGSGVVPF